MIICISGDAEPDVEYGDCEEVELIDYVEEEHKPNNTEKNVSSKLATNLLILFPLLNSRFICTVNIFSGLKEC